jgi:Ala-tRNA(Pro) deacylase
MELGVPKFDTYPVLGRLKERGILYSFFEHPAVFTVEEGKELLSHIPGQGTKNLFITDQKKSQFGLVTVCEEKRVDLRQLGEQIGFGRVSFGSPERLKNLLDVEPGSVSPLAILSPGASPVQFFLDEDLLLFDQIQAHPLKNTATVVFNPKEVFLDFFRECGIQTRAIKIPCV